MISQREHQLERRRVRERAHCLSETPEQREERLRKQRDRVRHAVEEICYPSGQIRLVETKIGAAVGDTRLEGICTFQGNNWPSKATKRGRSDYRVLCTHQMNTWPPKLQKRESRLQQRKDTTETATLETAVNWQDEEIALIFL